jgi:hypothetical protein
MKTPIFAALLSIQFAGLPFCSAAGMLTSSSSGSQSAGGSSFRPVISADGSRVVFMSHANNLVTNDNQREWLDVFLRDLVTSNTVLVSLNTSGVGGGNGNSFNPVISSNAQFVAFASEAGDLVNGDTNAASDVFVREMPGGMTRLVSVDLSGNAPVDTAPVSIIPLSANPMVSADGRWVFFESRATNLSLLPDTNNATDIFVRDLQSNVTALVTRNLSTAQAANSNSELAAITPDGARVVFISQATDLVAGATNALGDVYVRDLTSNVTHWASTSLDYTNGYRCVSAALSENGRYVAFTVSPTDGPSAVYRRDLTESVSVLVGTNALARAKPQISADGRYVTYETGTNIYRWDANSGLPELVNLTINSLPPTNGVARNATMTADGNSVVFVSNSAELTTNSSSGVFQIYARDMAGGVTHLVTAGTNGQPGAGSSEFSMMALAHDQPCVAFDSTDASLVDGDGNRASDVFVRDLSAATTELVSVRTPSLPRTSGLGHVYVGSDSVSADGRFVAFTSYDNDLLPGDTNQWSDIFIHDTLTGTTVTPGFSTNLAKVPVISANGRYVAYSRFLFNSGNGPFPYGTGTYRFDRQTGTNELIPSPEMFGSFSSVKSALSPDGNLFAFRFGGNLYVRDMAQGTNLIIGSAESISFFRDVDADAVFTPDGRFLLYKSTQIYAYDLSSNRTHLVSFEPGAGMGTVGYGGSLCVSGNSRFVVFQSSNFGPIVHDLLRETNGYVYDGHVASISSDGRFAAFTSGYWADPWMNQIVVLDRQSGARELVSISTAGTPAPREFGRSPLISGDGRFVVFGSTVSNLATNDANGFSDVFVRDRLLGTTTVISLNSIGTAGNAASALRPVMAADGRTVFFHSLANDLAGGDYNDKRDLFMLKLGGTDTEPDGMDDDWEVAYFETLTRDGSDDYDDDGASDLEEFRAGTDPKNSSSIFRVLTVTPVGGGNTTLWWTGNPARNYRAEFKDNLGTAGWTALSGTISWNGTTASIPDGTATNSTHRYYRVVRLP